MLGSLWFNSFSAGGGGADYELISTQVLGSTATSVVFSSLPSTYKHLELRYATKATSGLYAEPVRMRFNSDTGANYSYHQMFKADGRGVVSEGASSQTSGIAGWMGQNETSSAFAGGIVSLQDAFSTSKNKTVRSLSGFFSTNSDVRYMINQSSSAWFSTAAITSITLLPDSGASFSIGSRFSLYGLRG